MKIDVPRDWAEAVGAEFAKPYFQSLSAFVDGRRAAGPVLPPEEEVFAAFRATPFSRVRVVLLGQDPYPGAGLAHGLCFSVRPEAKIPPSLKNVFDELEAELELSRPSIGDLRPWAERGILLLNAVLTLDAGRPASHAKKGWETFTDTVIRAVSARSTPVVFLFWGGYARKKKKLVDLARHRVVEGAHPSPLSVKLFRGSKPFSAVNAALAEFLGTRRKHPSAPARKSGRTSRLRLPAARPRRREARAACD